ncbi:MAG: DEAD/DEAH box helicase family protein [Subdoligranulum sp.]
MTAVPQSSLLFPDASSSAMAVGRTKLFRLTTITSDQGVDHENPPLQQGHDGPRAPPLRPYQADTLQRMKSYEGNAALCVIATGLGKTRIFAEYIRCDVLENDHHILILSHREELVIQPLEYLKGLPCGIEQGTTHAHGEPIISASVQSLVGRLDKYNPYSIDTIIIDEAHHSAAPTYRKNFRVLQKCRSFKLHCNRNPR